MNLWRSILDVGAREVIVERLRKLTPDSQRRWGTMTAAQMIAHLTDQMTHTLGDVRAEPRPGLLRWAPVRWASIYLLPWPKGRVKGPPEAFVTKPASWEADVNRLIGLLERFTMSDERALCSEHALFGPMSRRDWGVFVHKHFDYHLRQFGA
jgi:hypothetical protein